MEREKISREDAEDETFFVPEEARWKMLKEKTENIGIALDKGFAAIEPDLLGDAYEYLIKMFADDAGKKGGEFYTPGTKKVRYSKRSK